MSWLALKLLFQDHAPKIVVGLAVLTGVVLFGLGIFWFRGVVADRDKFQAEARRYEAEALSAQNALAAQTADSLKALAERDATVREITEANRNLSEKLREAYAANPETRALAETCLPDSVIECFLK